MFVSKAHTARSSNITTKKQRKPIKEALPCATSGHQSWWMSMRPSHRSLFRLLIVSYPRCCFHTVLCLCMCVYVLMGMCVRAGTCVRVCGCVRVHAYLCAYGRVYVCTCVYVHVYVDVWVRVRCACVCVLLCACVRVYMCLPFMHICMYVMRVYIYACANEWIWRLPNQLLRAWSRGVPDLLMSPSRTPKRSEFCNTS